MGSSQSRYRGQHSRVSASAASAAGSHFERVGKRRAAKEAQLSGIACGISAAANMEAEKSIRKLIVHTHLEELG